MVIKVRDEVLRMGRYNDSRIKVRDEVLRKGIYNDSRTNEISFEMTVTYLYIF